ncbi:MAG: hypothetical protein ACQEXJ_17555 [Myxococcota bacterium]
MPPVARLLTVLLLAPAPLAGATPAEPVAQAVRAVATRCDVDPALGWVASCPGDEQGALEAALDTPDALPALARLLSDESPAVRTLAADRLGLGHQGVVARAESISSDTVDRLRRSIPDLTPYAASRVLPALAGAAHRVERLPEIVEGLSPRLAALAPAALVARAGDDALPALETLAGDGRPEVLAAALDAAASLDAEITDALCDRSAEAVHHEVAVVRVGAARLLARCRPEAVREAVADDARDEARRATLLWALYEARPDASTLALARKLRADDAPLGARANRIARALVEVHGVEEEPERPAIPEGTYSGRVRGTVSGTVRFTVRGGRITGARATVGGARLSLRGDLRGSRVSLTGSSGGNYASFEGAVRDDGTASGSWKGGVSGKVSKGRWSAKR